MKMKVGAKITLGFAIVLIILFIMGGYSYYKAAELDELATDLARANQRADAASKVQTSFLNGVMVTRAYMVYGDESYTKQTDQLFGEAIK